jgi:hypothetical protein
MSLKDLQKTYRAIGNNPITPSSLANITGNTVGATAALLLLLENRSMIKGEFRSKNGKSFRVYARNKKFNFNPPHAKA